MQIKYSDAKIYMNCTTERENEKKSQERQTRIKRFEF